MLRTEQVEWKSTAILEGTQFCPEVPFFENAAIRRVVISHEIDDMGKMDPQEGDE